MPKRNWAAIAQLPDYHTRIAVSLANDPEILACYTRGFPHLFIEGDDEGPLHVPLSALMEAAEAYARREYLDSEIWRLDRHFVLSWAAEMYSHLDIPIAYMWGEDNSSPVPEFAVKQLVGQKAQAGLIVTIDDKKYVVGSISFAGKYPEIGSTFTEPPPVTMMYLFDADFVALDK